MSDAPATFSTIELAEVADKPYDLDSLYIPLVDGDDQRYLAVVTHVDAREYHTGWIHAIPATQHVTSVTIDDNRSSSNPPVVKE